MTEVSEDVKESLSLVEDLKFFLATAPANWQENQVIRRYYLNNDEGFVSCVFWNNLYFITGTDIVRCILYKFQHFGRTVTDRKKFEEGIFLDLRNLKAGTDSVLENPKLEFLEFLYKNLCLRTQKKQKVFFWFNVPHDKLMADALERDIKKEKAGQTATQSQRELAAGEATHVTALRAPEPCPEDDDDDDFPLDYLDHAFNPQTGGNMPDWAGRDYAGRDYITLDTHAHSGAYNGTFEADFDLDAAVLQNLVNVASNDDYLIEQTVPARAPTLGLALQLYHPRLAKFYDEQAYMQPMSFGPPSAVMALYAPYYEQALYPHDMPQYPHIPFENEYLHPQLTPLAQLHQMAHMDQAVPYGYPEDFDYLMRTMPSQRQQDVSASMMRKRRQLQHPAKVTKPPRARAPDYESRFRVQVKKEDEMGVHTPDSQVHMAAYNGDLQHKHM
ncbi:hypothetical protein HF325_001401 [Metschnikowia pulcherrima]|uniref:Transcription factor STE12 n=1 Tax=Metschnikowia pulcherrima TaxID=27326 RepID=A0A8H7GYC3_9ASCO|nr:hypothetical protein HF325_001401 [Metschnikowia pulcherrima]